MKRCCGVAAEVAGVGRWCGDGVGYPQDIHKVARFSTGYPQLWRVVSWPIVDEKLTMASVHYLIEAMTRHIAAGIIIC